MRISDWSSDVCSSDLAMPFGSDKPGAREDAKVRRHGVLGDVELVGDFASGQPIRLVAHEKTEGVETRRLRERAESGNGRVIFHISSITDISCRTSWVSCWRSEERRVGKECVSECRYRGWQCHIHTKNEKQTSI